MYSPPNNAQNMGYMWGGLSTLLFFCSNMLLRYLAPQSVSKDVNLHWKWRNTVNSFMHSCITAVWSCLCILKTPEISQDLVTVHTSSAHTAISVSAGYFIYDLIDLLIGHRKRSSFELVFHHVLVILCFGLAITTYNFLGFCIVGLLVEVNSVFLHARQLMNLQRIHRGTKMYRINSIVNIGTFIVFRIITLGLLMLWVHKSRQKLTAAAYLLGSVALPIILVMNVVLFLRILNTDFLKRSHTSTTISATPTMALKKLLLHENEDWFIHND